MNKSFLNLFDVLESPEHHLSVGTKNIPIASQKVQNRQRFPKIRQFFPRNFSEKPYGSLARTLSDPLHICNENCPRLRGTVPECPRLSRMLKSTGICSEMMLEPSGTVGTVGDSPSQPGTDVVAHMYWICIYSESILANEPHNVFSSFCWLSFVVQMS